MAVRSDYIKKIMETKTSLENQFAGVVEESMKNLISESAKSGLRSLLNEADTNEDDEDDTFDVEEVDTTDNESLEDELATGDEEPIATATEEGELNLGDIWNGLEDKKVGNEYDLRGMDNGTLVKVLKAMSPEDGIKVVANGDGTATLEVDGDVIDGEQEFIIDLDELQDQISDMVSESINVEDAIDVEFDEDDLGYTTEYQKQSAMTTDGVDDSRPYGKEVDHEDDFVFEVEVKEPEKVYEVELQDDKIDELTTVTQNGPASRGTSMTHGNNNIKNKSFRNSDEAGVRVKGTSQNSYAPEDVSENKVVKRKLNTLMRENREMKGLINLFQDKLQEAMLVNASMGYTVKLINENTTSNDEKKNILKRFSDCKTLAESKQLYDTISRELKSVQRSQVNVGTIIENQTSTGKQNLVETTMYQSPKANEALSFMNRLNKVK